jgi:hypothetical protein
MKKLIMLSVIGILTLSSFNVKDYTLKKEKDNRAMDVWTYNCGDGRTGSFYMPEGSNYFGAMSVAFALCSA